LEYNLIAGKNEKIEEFGSLKFPSKDELFSFNVISRLMVLQEGLRYFSGKRRDSLVIA
jgi:hypothetical protein